MFLDIGLDTTYAERYLYILFVDWPGRRGVDVSTHYRQVRKLLNHETPLA